MTVETNSERRDQKSDVEFQLSEMIGDVDGTPGSGAAISCYLFGAIALLTAAFIAQRSQFGFAAGVSVITGSLWVCVGIGVDRMAATVTRLRLSRRVLATAVLELRSDKHEPTEK